MPHQAKRRNITLDSRAEEIISLLVPREYPSRSELIRDLIRKEGEKRGIET